AQVAAGERIELLGVKAVVRLPVPLQLRDLMLEPQRAEQLEGLLQDADLLRLEHPEITRGAKAVEGVVGGNVADERGIAGEVDDGQQTAVLDVERLPVAGRVDDEVAREPGGRLRAERQAKH